MLTDRTFARHLSVVSAEMDLSPINTVIGLTILLGGVEHLERPGGEGWRYAASDTPPPQDVRRSVNISSLARSLSLPRETVRRRCEELVSKGVVHRVHDGLKADTAMGHGLEYRQAVLLSQLPPLADLLTQIGYRAAPDLPRSHPRLNLDEAVRRVRQFSRILLRLQLRHYGIMVRLGGDLQRGQILTRILDLSGVADDPAPASGLRPISRLDLSEAVSLNRETTRRCLLTLKAAGFVEKAANGYLPSPQLLASRRLEEALKETAANLRQQVRLLSAHGFIHEPSPGAGIPATPSPSAAPVEPAGEKTHNGRPEDCPEPAGPAQESVASPVASQHQSGRSNSHPPLRSLASSSPDPDLSSPDGDLRAYVAAQTALQGMMQAFRALADADPLDAIIAATVSMASVAHLDRPGGEGAQFASFDQTPPPEARKPISVSAVARSLGLPRETVRRRAKGLAEAGWLQVSPAGLGSVPAFMDITGHKQFLARVNQAGLTLLEASGYQTRAEGVGGPAGIDIAAVEVRDRLFARLCLQFALGLYEAATALTGHLERSLALTTLIAMAYEPSSATSFDPERPAADQPPRLVARLAMARRLDIHPETMRRLLRRLEADGQVRRQAMGYEPTVSLLEGPALARSTELTAMQTRKFIKTLSWAGFLAPSSEASAG